MEHVIFGTLRYFSDTLRTARVRYFAVRWPACDENRPKLRVTMMMMICKLRTTKVHESQN